MADLEATRKRIGALEARAFELAKRRFDGGDDSAAGLKPEAEEGQKELRELARTLRSEHPGAYDSISEQVSEALLDFKYALTAPPAVSLRMNQYIESSEKRSSR